MNLNKTQEKTIKDFIAKSRELLEMFEEIEVEEENTEIFDRIDSIDLELRKTNRFLSSIIKK